jgi:PAS domain-containing protein
VERAQVLAALRESEARITSITEAIPGAVFQFRMDDAGTVPFVSRGPRPSWGRAAALQSGALEAFSLVAPEERERLVRSIQISARDLTRWNEVFRVQTAAGARWIRGEAVPARDLAMGTVWNGILFDVSDQKSAQEQLEKLGRTRSPWCRGGAGCSASCATTTHRSPTGR